MSVSIYIFLFLIISISLLLLYFKVQKAKISADHFNKIDGIELEIERNKHQIKVRGIGLNKYNFLKYNLDEALIVQPEILVH